MSFSSKMELDELVNGSYNHLLKGKCIIYSKIEDKQGTFHYSGSEIIIHGGNDVSQEQLDYFSSMLESYEDIYKKNNIDINLLNPSNFYNISRSLISFGPNFSENVVPPSYDFIRLDDFKDKSNNSDFTNLFNSAKILSEKMHFATIRYVEMYSSENYIPNYTDDMYSDFSGFINDNFVQPMSVFIDDNKLRNYLVLKRRLNAYCSNVGNYSKLVDDISRLVRLKNDEYVNKDYYDELKKLYLTKFDLLKDEEYLALVDLQKDIKNLELGLYSV
jgi:hypothetical protein